MLVVVLLACMKAAEVLAAEAPVPIVIRDVSLFDSVAGVMLPHRTVVISGETITGIGTPDKAVNIPAGAQTIDGSGKFVIPGLIDAHVHLVHLADRTHVTGDQFLPLFLGAGVTSVRSAGDAIVAEAGVAHFANTHPERS